MGIRRRENIMANKCVKIPESHKFVLGGSNYSPENGVNVIKIKFCENISKKRATQIAMELKALIEK